MKKLLFLVCWLTAASLPASDHPFVFESSGDFERHHVGLFLGGATRFDDRDEDETDLAIGIEYEFRLNQAFGVGGLIEGIPTSGVRDLVLATPVVWHPVDGLKLSLAPGIEFHDQDKDFMIRFAAGYDFRIGRFTIGPDVSLDLTHHSRTLVYGVFGGVGF
jgi:hypothetical protein